MREQSRVYDTTRLTGYSYLLWWIHDDPQLSETVRKIIADGANEVFFSAASSWELAIKTQLGKLDFPTNLEQFVTEQLTQNNFTVLPITLNHTLQVYKLPLHHRDPFDRILIAQSQVEEMPILTADSLITQYGVKVIW